MFVRFQEPAASRGRLRTVLACAVGLVLAFAAPPAAFAAEWPSPQAVAANAAFLSNPALPDPPTPAAICVVDTGVDPVGDIAHAVVHRASVFKDGYFDDVGGLGGGRHGTYVAGVIASAVDGVGSSGIWPKAKIVSVRAFPGGGGAARAWDYQRAMKEDCRNNAFFREVMAVNLSIAGINADDGLSDTVAWARRFAGWNVVAATGNNGASVAYPARLPDAIAVAASTVGGEPCAFSNLGPEVDLVAPGCDIVLSPNRENSGSVLAGRGTSFSAPIVTAVLAALRAYGGINADRAEAILRSTAKQGPGGAAIDAAAAFRAAALGHLVDAYQPSVHETGEPPREPNTAPQAGLVSATRDPFAPLRPRRPTLTRVDFRRGVLDIVVRKFPREAELEFRIGGRAYVRRRTTRLRVRSLRWKTVRVRARLPGMGLSPALVVRRPRRSLRQNPSAPSRWTPFER